MTARVKVTLTLELEGTFEAASMDLLKHDAIAETIRQGDRVGCEVQVLETFE